MRTRNKVLLGLLIWPLGIYWALQGAGASRTASIVSASVAGVLLLGITIAAASGGGSSSSSTKPSAETATTTVSKAKPAAPKPATPKPATPEPATPGGPTAEQKDIAKRSQKYVDDARICMAASQIAFQLAGSATDINVAYQHVRDARDVCERIRSELLDMDDNKFGDQATTVWGAVDYMKSADNAALAYLDTQRPSKLSDAKQHQADAYATFAQGISEINARRQELGIAPLRKLKLG